MKTKLLPLIALVLIIFSCKDVEEPPPNSQIEGKYQSVSNGNNGWSSAEFNFVSDLVFKSDGTVHGEDYTTEIGSDTILGYRGYFSGTYSIIDGKVSITYKESYHMGIADINYLPKEALVLYEGEDYSVEYAVKEDYSELSYVCPPNAFCTYVQVYVKVN